MPEPTAEEVAAAAAAEAAANAPTPEQAAAIAAEAAAAELAAGETPEAKIARLEAEVKSARGEAGKERVNAKKTAADEARAELAQTVGRALGIITDEPVDPAKLLEQVTASQTEARQSRVELAVFRTADAAGADPIALLDSRAFLAKAADIEPNDTAALVAAMTAAVAENPRLGKAASAGPGMKPNPAQGGSSHQPLGLDAQIAAAEAKGDLQTAIRLKSSKSISS